jgi:hypothetical protein
VIHSPEGAWGATWQKFYEPIAEEMRGAKQIRVPYLLIGALQAVPAENRESGKAGNS